jgi:hypothetical protein
LCVSIDGFKTTIVRPLSNNFTRNLTGLKTFTATTIKHDLSTYFMHKEFKSGTRIITHFEHNVKFNLPGFYPYNGSLSSL